MAVNTPDGAAVTALGGAARVPPGSRLPRQLQGLVFLASRRSAMRALRRRYGPVFSIDVPLFGPAVVVSDLRAGEGRPRGRAPAELR